MRKILTVSVYVITLSAVRLIDSFLTYLVLREYDADIKELNPLAQTDGLWGVFLSPFPLLVSFVASIHFALMVFNSEKLMGNSRPNFFWDVLVKDSIEFPFVVLLFITLATVQNASLFLFERPVMPRVIDSLMYDYPVAGLLFLVLVLWLISARFLKRITFTILRYS